MRLSNLARVGWPGGLGRSYHYEDARHPNLLTGITQRGGDGTSQRLSNYAYDADGYAVESAPLADDRVRIDERVPPRPGQPGRTVLEDGAGRRTSYTHALVGGERRILESRGPGCPSCAAGDMRHRHNERGQELEATRLDGEGRPVGGIRRSHDAWGRVTRVERVVYPAPGKADRAAARLLVRYEYMEPSQTPEGFPVAFDRPTLIARPSVVEGREHRIEIAWNGRGQITRVKETGWRPAVPLPDGTAEPPFIKTSAQTAQTAAPPEPIERTTTYRYAEINGRSLLAEIDGPLPNGPKGSPEDSDVTRYHWDPQGNHIEQVTQPGGLTRRLQRDAGGRVTRLALEDGYRHVETLSAYTPRGVLVELTRRAWKQGDPDAVLSETQHYQADLFERLVAATAADGTTQQLAYDGQGRLSGYTAPGGERAEWRYDAQNRPFAQVVFDARGEVEIARMTVRDEAGRVLATLSPEGVDTFHPVLPDSAGRTSRVPVAAPRAARGGEERIEPGGRRARVWRDDFGRTVANWDPDGGWVLHRYETGAEGERRTQTYPGRQPTAGQAPRWETLSFDPAGRLVRREHPGCAETLAYEGRLLARLDSCGSSQHFGRDAFGLITAHRQEIDGKSWQEAYRHGPGGRLLERRTAGGATLFYRYDGAGRLTDVARQSGWANALSGNAIGRVLVGWLPEGWTREALQSDMRWTALGARPGGAAHANGARWRDVHDRAGRLSEYRLETDAGTVYEARTRWRQDKPVQEERDGQVRTRLYDPLGRLLPPGLEPDKLEGAHPWLLPAGLLQAAARPTGARTASLPVTRARTAADVSAPPPKIPTRFYAPNGLRTAAWGGGNSDGGPARNNWGEQTERGGQRLVWDDEGNLAGIERDGRRIATYRYDARGVRVSKTLHAASGDVKTYYLYDAGRRLSAEADGTGRVTREYLYHGTRPYAMLEGEKTYAVHSDARGLPLLMLDERQKVVWRGHWDDWGAGTAPPDPAEPALELRLAGQYHDAESGLHYNVHRYYDPAQGAYVSPDPLGGRPGEHRYAYLNHDPLGGTDPLGLFKVPWTSAIGNLTTGSFPLAAVGPGTTDGGHADIVNAAFALYHQQAGEVQFSRDIINQIILNNYHTDAAADFMPGTASGQGNPLNHFDNPNYSGAMYTDASKSTPLGSYPGSGDWILAALGQIDQNRNAYGASPKPVGSKFDISENIGRLGQNLHTLADFYAHTNWVDSAGRGGCYKVLSGTHLIDPGTPPAGYVKETETFLGVTYYKVYKAGYVPVGLGNTGLWDGSTDVGTGGLFSGTANPRDIYREIVEKLAAGDSVASILLVYGTQFSDIATTIVSKLLAGTPIENILSLLALDEIQNDTDLPYTHAYWNKDSPSSAGGKEALSPEKIEQLLLGKTFFWKAEIYSPSNPPPGNDVTTTGIFEHPGDFISDHDGKNPNYELKPGDRIYVATQITTAYELAMALAIQDTVEEIEKFYEAAKGVDVGDKKMADILKPDASGLESIIYKEFPPKTGGYTPPGP
jgi:RHS repeat-associated protein